MLRERERERGSFVTLMRDSVTFSIDVIPKEWKIIACADRFVAHASMNLWNRTEIVSSSGNPSMSWSRWIAIFIQSFAEIARFTSAYFRLVTRQTEQRSGISVFRRITANRIQDGISALFGDIAHTHTKAAPNERSRNEMSPKRMKDSTAKNRSRVVSEHIAWLQNIACKTSCWPISLQRQFPKTFWNFWCTTIDIQRTLKQFNWLMPNQLSWRW